MRALTTIAVLATAFGALEVPAMAASVTARVSGGNIAVHTGPDDRYPVVGRLANGTEIQVDYCTQTDGDSRRGTLFGDGGHMLWPSGAKTFCRIPDYGWVERSWIVGRGLVNVTPPDFAGPGW